MTNCLFCKIANKAIPASFVYEDEDIFAINDIAPQAPTHILVIPKVHIASLEDATPAQQTLLGKIQLVAGKLAKENGLTTGYRLVNNCGNDGGQAVAHLHYHLLGGRKLQWPPG